MLAKLLQRHGPTFRRAISRARAFSQKVAEASPKPEFPIWKSLGLFMVTGASLLIYFRNERKKQIASKPVKEVDGHVGTPLIGGSFDLIDCDGKPFSDKDLLGKYYLLYFGFTHCPDICPEELTKIAEIIQAVKSTVPDAPIVPVFVTCDPERDSPAVIKSYLKEFISNFVGLTGSPDVVKEMAKKFRVYYRPTQTSDNGDYLVDHSIFFYLMGPDGKFVTNFGRSMTAKECTETVLKEMFNGKQ